MHWFLNLLAKEDTIALMKTKGYLVVNRNSEVGESKINDIIGKDSISYSFLSIWNKIY